MYVLFLSIILHWSIIVKYDILIYIVVIHSSYIYIYNYYIYICPSHLRCPRLWLRTIAGKSKCGGSVAFPWEAHPKRGNYDGV